MRLLCILTLMDVRWLRPVTYNLTSHILIVFLSANDEMLQIRLL
jgi:hypothetical protein